MNRVANAIGLAKPGRRMVIHAPSDEVFAVVLDRLYRRRFQNSPLDLNPVLGATTYSTTVRVLKYGSAVRGLFFGGMVENLLPFLAFTVRSVRNAMPGEVVVVCEFRGPQVTVLTLSLVQFHASVAVNSDAIFCAVIEEIATHFRSQGRLIEEGTDTKPRHLDPDSPANQYRFAALKKLARGQRSSRR
ncbi:hypothetical protein D9V34_15415 [Mycetocola lacteus]|uniref:Uncharacterized protein n=1 Tax=Mycetocola lacteus TaxID=76637 RepID=A0A3L7AGP1_9MICO|nr:hypothetical protein [Mycetocola lacteus]RLP79194.1 hypothetical protein D9V34_15415 [Mycetocola lacteus]